MTDFFKSNIYTIFKMEREITLVSLYKIFPVRQRDVR